MKPFGRTWSRCENYINKVDLKVIQRDDVGWIQLAVVGTSGSLFNTKVKLLVP